ncbi:MAG: Transglutaminase, partial [Acidobacteriota bacterium]|nr:Transglutaminase [Acidobacteriota bacterium]
MNKIDGSGASFTGDIQQKGNSILIEKTIKVKKRVYQPEDWKSVRDSVLEFKKPGSGVLVIVPAR